MSQRQFASVLFAVLGVFIALNWLPQIVVAIGLFAQPTETSAGHQANSAYAITLLIGTLIAVLLAITLVVMRERLAGRLFPADTGPLAARDAQAVALSVLGCYFAIGAIPRLVGAGRFGVGRIEWAAVTQLVLGVSLFFGARGVARLWAAARSTGSSSST
ncbi:MAG: hypothetical protein DMD54_17560 [Gemmatimonadetes bacterium]|nr:MAG: hypothetical protein DMD54_17560 [Gemmatimonadota bacterium]